jgi:glycosyltransferase involved in cell wall biosynthesis
MPPGGRFVAMPELCDLRVCFLAGTLGAGGAERQLFYMTRALRESGAQVKVLSLTEGELYESQLRGIGVPVEWVGQDSGRLGRLRRILSVLRKDKPHILQSQHFYTNLYAAVAGRWTGCRDIGALRSDVDSEVRSHSAILGRASLKLPRLLAANSHHAIENARRYGLSEKRLRLLPNVIDTDLFPMKPLRSDGIVTLLLAGRLSAEKRADRFLRLLSRLRKESRIEIRGIIAGDGPLQSEMKSLALNLGLGYPAVEFTGHIDNMASLYHRSDLLVLTSEFEGTPNVILEAMASGLPVVATAVGGVLEVVVENKTGSLLAPYDEDKMSAMIAGFAASPDQRRVFGLEARKIIETEYSTKRLPLYLEDLYRTALA